jgi:hypothetical protein
VAPEEAEAAAKETEAAAAAGAEDAVPGAASNLAFCLLSRDPVICFPADADSQHLILQRALKNRVLCHTQHRVTCHSPSHQILVTSSP